MQWTNGDVWVLETRIREGTHTFKVRAGWVPCKGLAGGSRHMASGRMTVA